MPSLALESDRDYFDLDSVLKGDRGVQVLAGVTGFGLPPVQVRWLEGAGDGATYRGRRVLPRDIDLPLLILGQNRADLSDIWTRFALMMAGKCKLRLIEDDGSSWWTYVYRVGGGDYTYGVDTDGETEIRTVVTLRAPDPFFTAEIATQQVIGGK